MKKFKYGLEITGSKRELDAMITDLTFLGYKQTVVIYYDKDSLCTNFGGVKNNVGYDKINERYQTITVPASNKDLVLALAASVDDDCLHVGEYVVKNSNYSGMPNGRPFKISKLSETNPDGVFLEGIVCNHIGGYTTKNFVRKATKEEIFAHFDKPMNKLSNDAPDFTENQIIKTRLETLLEDHPDLQEDLAELFPEVIERPDYRMSVEIKDEAIYEVFGNPIAWIRGAYEHKEKSLYLCSKYDWEIVTDGEGEKVLLPTRKK